MSTATRSVNILDLQPEIAALMPQLMAKFEEVLKSGQFILGPEVTALEKETAAFIGVKHAIAVNSGTDALMIALRAAGVGPGDEVITTPFSFFATAESISNVGAKPVFVDVDLDSMNIDPSLVEAAVSPRAKAIMPVHLFGRPAAMSALTEIARRRGLKVVEDAAQSFGAAYAASCGECGPECTPCLRDELRGRQTGALGFAGCFSFYPTKNLGAYGDAGLITTDSDEAAELSRKLRAHGSAKRYHNEMLGYNSRMDSLQAMILRLKLPLLPGYNQARRRIAQRYNELLAGIPGLIVPEAVEGHIFHQYTVRITEKSRDEVAAALKARGVGSMIYYPIPQDRLEVYAGQYPRFPNSDLLADQVLSLPIYPHLPDEDLEHVAASLADVLAA